MMDDANWTPERAEAIGELQLERQLRKLIGRAQDYLVSSRPFNTASGVTAERALLDAIATAKGHLSASDG